MTGFEFHFLRPLWLLALLPLAAVLWRLTRSNGDADAWRGVVDPHLLPDLLTDGGGNARRLPLVLLGTGWLLIVLALAGPVWDRLPEPLYQARQFRVVVLDLSPSMNASDLAPSRLARARFETLDLLRQSDEGQTALLAFGAEPFVVSPLTSDVETIAAQVPSLDTGLLPVSGARRTDLALDQAGELLRQAGATEGDVILISDGMGPAGATQAAARRLWSDGYRVSVLGVGTPEGAPVPLAEGGYLRDREGAISLPKLDVAGLRSLADAGGGRYVEADFGDRDVAALKSGRAAAATEETGEQQTGNERWREEGPWLLLVLLPLAAFAFRRGWLSPLVVLVLLVPPPPVHAFTWDDLWSRPDQRATQLLENGSPEEAAQVFERPDWRAAAQYQASDYEQALQSLQGLGGVDADYNTGNALARLGRLEEAVDAYDRSLARNPGDLDARHNRQLVQDLIDRQKRQQEQQQSGQQDQQDQDQKQDQEQDGEQQAQQSQSGGQGSQQEQPDARQADASGSQGEQQQESDEGQSVQDGDQGGQQANAQEATEARDGEGDGQDPQQSGEQGAGEQVQQAQRGEGQDSLEQPQPSEEDQAAGKEPQQAGEQETAEPETGTVEQQTQTAGGQDAETGPQGQQNANSQGPGEESAEQRAGDTGGDDQGHQADLRQDLANAADKGASRQQAPGQTGDTPGLADLLGDQATVPPGARAADTVSGLDLEDRQAVEQMLRRVEDDPAGLLRQRFLLQHLRRTGQLP